MGVSGHRNLKVLDTYTANVRVPRMCMYISVSGRWASYISRVSCQPEAFTGRLTIVFREIHHVGLGFRY